MNKILLIIAGSLISAVASATSTLNYVGNPYTTAVSAYGYSTSNFVTASINLSSSLSPNLFNYNATSLITDWWISDGVYTVNSSTTNPGFVISTDSAGSITAWDFTAFNCGQVGIAQIETSFGLAGISPCGTWKDYDVSSISFIAFTGSVQNITPGQWTVSEVPEPSTLSIFGVGVAALLALRIRNRKGSSYGLAGRKLA